MPTLSHILNDRIGKNGKSKAYVASELKVSEKTIENYMRGKRSPRPEAMVKLSKILGFSLAELSEQNVSRETPKEKMTTYSNSPAYQTKGISADEKDRIIKEKDERIKELKEQLEFLKGLIQEKKEKR